MNETIIIIMRLAWYKTLINSVTYLADTPIGSYEIDVITDNVWLYVFGFAMHILRFKAIQPIGKTDIYNVLYAGR